MERVLKQVIKILSVEDSPDDHLLLLNHLKKSGLKIEPQRVDCASDLILALEEKKWDIILCDYNLPQFGWADALRIIKTKWDDIPCIIVSGSVGEDKAVETMRGGATDYIMKDNLTRLVPAILRELLDARSKAERRQFEIALKNSEENLRQAQKYESIGQLAGGIAHDFNNILAIIFMQADTLTAAIKNSPNGPQLLDQVVKGLEQVKKSGERATNLTRQLLAFSRKQVIQPKIINLNDLVLDMQKMFARILEENIVLKTDLSPNLKNIKADPGHIEQIILNLVVNSRDAMPQGGLLEIKTENDFVDHILATSCNVSPGAHCLLTVTDTGTGISPDAIKNIFTPFFTTKPVGKGTGLGLSTVYGIVKQNNGLIFVDSKVNVGTTFKIYFPSTDEKVQAAAPVKTEISTVNGNETILVVEDEEDLNALISQSLTANGYKVFSASNGMQALEQIKKINKPVHLIITDVVMPFMGGSDLAKEALLINKKTKIMYQSGYTEDTLIQNGIHSGNIHFLEKPYTIKVLLNKVRTILG